MVTMLSALGLRLVHRRLLSSLPQKVHVETLVFQNPEPGDPPPNKVELRYMKNAERETLFKAIRNRLVRVKARYLFLAAGILVCCIYTYSIVGIGQETMMEEPVDYEELERERKKTILYPEKWVSATN